MSADQVLALAVFLLLGSVVVGGLVGLFLDGVISAVRWWARRRRL